MELFDNLAAHGLPASTLQVLIVVGIAIYLIGMYWQIIVTGCIVAFCVAVFAMPAQSSPNADKLSISPDDAPIEFIEDCKIYNKTGVEECKRLWKERE